MKKATAWTDDEIKTLKENAHLGMKHLLILLRRSRGSIYTKAWNLNIPIVLQPTIWTQDRIDFMLENYPKYGGEYCRDNSDLSLPQIRNFASQRKLEYTARTQEGHRFCRKCFVEKPLSEYHKASSHKYGVADVCIPCAAIKSSLKRHRDRDKIRSEKRNYYLRNRESIIRKTYARKKEKLCNDPAFRMMNSIRKRFKWVFHTEAFSSQKEEIIGCSASELTNHIQEQFSKEMNWSNYTQVWTLDHIIPCSCLTHYPEYLHLVFNYRNHYPIPTLLNIQKGACLISARSILLDKISKFGSDLIYEQMIAFLDRLIRENPTQLRVSAIDSTKKLLASSPWES